MRIASKPSKKRCGTILLEEVARELFEVRGFGDISAEEIVADAGVARGALYHHYGGKEGLLEAVAEAAMRRLHDNIAKASLGASHPLGALKLGMQRFFELATAPRVQRVPFVDAPAVLGWQRWRKLDERYGFGLLKQGVDLAIAAGQLRPQASELVAHILLSATIEAAMLIANSPCKAELRDEAQAILARLIDAFA